MIKLVALVSLVACNLQASDIQWTRIKGTIKATNSKTQIITVENPEGDLVTLHLDPDIDIIVGKDVLKPGDLKLGDKVMLMYNPKPPAPVNPDQPVNGIYSK